MTIDLVSMNVGLNVQLHHTIADVFVNRNSMEDIRAKSPGVDIYTKYLKVLIKSTNWYILLLIMTSWVRCKSSFENRTVPVVEVIRPNVNFLQFFP